MRSFLLIALNIEAVLAKKTVSACLKIICCFHFLAAIFSYNVIKALPSNAESCEEQGDGKQNFVGLTTAKLWPFLSKCSRNTEKK